MRSSGSSVALPAAAWIGLAGVTALSECQRCEQNGDCALAFRGAPGQFCGAWLDRANQRQSCCCPVDALCRVSTYACNCAFASSRRGHGTTEDPLLWLWWLLGGLALLACCAGCLFMLCARTKRTPPDDSISEGSVPLALPVGPSAQATTYGTAPGAATGGPGYAPTAPLYATPGYAAPAYGAGYGGGMGAGTGAALGGAAGFLGGLALGEALGDHGRSYDAGDDGGGGVYDAGVGDFSGDF